MGIRQGDLLAPFLFGIAMEALQLIVERIRRVRLISKILLPNNRPGIPHFGFIDDVMFLTEWPVNNFKNLNRLLPNIRTQGESC